ncbi:NRDE family protein [Curtobacterium sp. RRHDQ10]|uniref:NRDE family protein n=1 Tax=Curtobacterium phyllosphaerae TaxID=3413379 RepID=UPI003BF25E52
MCTVIVRVAPGTAWPVTLLALRDESPERPWDPPGAWWPTMGQEVRGVHDRSAGGAWLAVSDRTRSLAVVLNRSPDEPVPATPTTRGTLPLDAVVYGRVPAGTPTARPFNLVHADAEGVRVTSWDGVEVRTSALAAGVHMIAETAADDRRVPRIGRWLDAFREGSAPAVPPSVDPAEALAGAAFGAGLGAAAAGGAGAGLGAAAGAWAPWFQVLDASRRLDPTDPEAIVRDHTGPDGRFTTLSVVSAAIGTEGVVLRHSRLDAPAAIDGGVRVGHA